MAKINPIIIRLPANIKDKYDLPQYRGIFDNDGMSDRLILKVLPEDYNAAHPVKLTTALGYSAPYTEVERELYQLEATDRDRRSSVKRFALQDLIAAGGNLSVYGVKEQTISCNVPLIAIEDYHECDRPQDAVAGFTNRVGTLNVESLKGSYRNTKNNSNYNTGCRIIFTHTHQIVNNSLEVYVYK